ncbi:unnamed protein product [Mucor hiemalis]
MCVIGLALAAITNEAKVHIISRHKSSLETFEGNGDCISSSKHTGKNQPGTSVIVRDLFYKFPVRRRHSIVNPYHHDAVIIESVKRLIVTFSLCFYHISFTLIDIVRNTKLLNIKKSNNSVDIFRQLFGQELIKYTECVDLHEDNVKVNGFFSTSGYPNKVYYYINNFLVPSNNRLYKEVANLFSSNNLIVSTSGKPSASKSKGKIPYQNRRTILFSKAIIARISLQKYPIFLIKFECSDWSSYEVSMYLDILAEFSSFDQILYILKIFTLKFLRLFKLPSTATDSFTESKPKEKKRRYHLVESPYLTHSSGVSNSTFESDNTFVSSGDVKVESSKYVTWCDPKSNRTFIIDRNTGNSHLSAPTSRISHTRSANLVDRSHLKRIKPKTQSIFGNSSDTTKQSESGNIFPALQHDTPYKLLKADLQDSKVLGQVDDKYIVIKRRKDIDNDLIVIIDQHAADERVKLERMLQPLAMVSMTLEPSICLILDSQLDFHVLTDSRTLKYLKIWGIHISTTFGTSNIGPSTIFNASNNQKDSHRINLTPEIPQQSKHLNKVYVTQLPHIIVERCVLDHSLLKNLIKEYAYWIVKQEDDGVIRKVCPKGIMNIMKSKACRSAIMFNDKLNLVECKTIVQQLSKCKHPFQCAHGRPTAFPILVNLSSSMKSTRKIDWSQLLL